MSDCEISYGTWVRPVFTAHVWLNKTGSAVSPDVLTDASDTAYGVVGYSGSRFVVIPWHNVARCEMVEVGQ